jgi:Fe-S cluster biosynthesis and repair protein YggX
MINGWEETLEKQTMLENVISLTQKVKVHRTYVRQTFWFHPLQCTICGAYCETIPDEEVKKGKNRRKKNYKKN